ncbi:MAG: hypothetical protein A3D31_06605 [Candidatus Fluviicola riflensis]|nr:MAG: hypothetical protein CHH17_08405 [Candidatus Fluviicola riflensis]OGS79630.1 MAG: hypothetical protein A3D31_06605 [Candidatus Fluviicola riflensis]OGS87061.1 MAG: hypothetical protein A2724_06065 [Fluviicola sp. RIFCSPHIGHO2_01_FULL_43_53]OGS89853.1 MAG: hypothetical protein A3E30_02815 [Fluviicola sp. RIFCSPHIGHO2_12_FULL_43_24]
MIIKETLMPATKKETQVPSIDKWPITTERFVAFIDIMGFKDMVMKMPHSAIYKMMLAIDSSKTISEEIAIDKKNNQLVKSTTYSDSIMLYSKNKTVGCFEALIAAVSGLTYDLFIEGIPHKGAMAYGKMTLDSERSIFFGQPLIDAYLLQEELHFYGVIIHGTVEQVMHRQLNQQEFIKRYDCHLKNGKSNHYTVHPMYISASSAAHFPDEHEKAINSLVQMKHKTSGHLRRYIDNTDSYFKYIFKETK